MARKALSSQAELDQALAMRLLAMGDDELILGHRNSEWCGHAPILEEDIAFANIALDELGHAQLWYSLYANVLGEDEENYPDRIVFVRKADAFRNAPLMELPKGDWGFSMMRQYLFDAAEAVWLEQLVSSLYQPLAETATKVQKEEIYHLRHTSAWVKRLGLGTNESNHRMQKALDELWPYAVQYFEPLPEDLILVMAGFVSDSNAVQIGWEKRIAPFLRDANLNVPTKFKPITMSRIYHSEALSLLLQDMQSVARLQQDARW